MLSEGWELHLLSPNGCLVLLKTWVLLIILVHSENTLSIYL